MGTSDNGWSKDRNWNFPIAKRPVLVYNVLVMAYTDPDHEQELIEWERDLERQGPTDDYMREAYGAPCSCGALTWGGDCPRCMTDDEF